MGVCDGETWMFHKEPLDQLADIVSLGSDVGVAKGYGDSYCRLMIHEAESRHAGYYICLTTALCLMSRGSSFSVRLIVDVV